MQMTSSPCPVLTPNADSNDAIEWLQEVTEWIGPGFHPDTPAADYSRSDNGEPTFLPADATRLDFDLTACFKLLGDIKPYDIAISVQRRLLGMPLVA